MRLGTSLVTCALVLAAAGCAGDGDDTGRDGDEPPAVELDQTSTPADAATTASAAETRDAIEAAVDGYYRAVIKANAKLGKGKALDPVTTPEWREELLGDLEANLFSKGQQLVGGWVAEVESVEVAGDTATATVCVDGTQVFVVPVGEGVGSGARGQDRNRATVTLAAPDGEWLVDRTERGSEAC